MKLTRRINLSFAIILFFVSVSEGQTVNNFFLKDTDNIEKSYSELKGEQLTVIDFWASWCKPCRKAIPELNNIYSDFLDRGVNVIGINCDGPRSVSKVMPMVKSMQIKYPVLMDINADVMNNLSLSAFPTLILIDSKDKIVWIHEGFSEGDEKKISEQIEKNLTR